MEYEILLSIVGGFGTLGLSINGFFLRGIYKDLNDVKIVLAEISTEAKNKESDIEELKENYKELQKDIVSLRERMHSVEGAQSQVLLYLKEEK